MSMKPLISEWDGKNIDYISSIYQSFENDEKFLDGLILFMKEADLQRGASWLIKHYVDKGGSLSSTQFKELTSLSSKFDHWETKLHFLQILPSNEIPAALKNTIYEFLISGVASDAKFVRAWSYGGLITLSEQYPEIRKPALSYVKPAMENETAAIKARIRQASKKSDYWKFNIL